MFVDKVLVTVQAGDGGDGLVSFRHEKFIDKGGPDGGDGGNGGSVVLVASRNQNTLASFRYQKLLKAPDGQAGGKRKRHGRTGEDLLVPVPVGTAVLVDNKLVADLTEDGQRAVIAEGGKGGFGNAHFTSSTRQTPRVAEKGEAGAQFEAALELKMIADVGLVGLPNAGKSTLLAATSNAKPEIANYPFTTLRPNLGMVEVDKDVSLLVADIPGLIEGASEGKGLGDDFLRHVERTGVLVHMIDAYADDVAAAYQTIQAELASYVIDLSGKPQIVALNKVEGLDADMVEHSIHELQRVVPKGTPVYAVSAQSKQGIKELLYAASKLVSAERQRRAEAEAADALPVIRLAPNEDTWHVAKVGGVFMVTGAKIERFARRTDFDNPHAVQRLRDIMKKMGIVRELNRQGINPDDKITVGSHAFNW